MELNALLLLLLTVILMTLSTRLFYKASGTLAFGEVNPISLFYYFILVFSVIGTTLIAMKVDDHHMARYLRHSDIRLLSWELVMILMIVFPLIVIGLNKLAHYDPKSYRSYLHTKPVLSASLEAEFITLLIASVVCIGAIIYTFAVIGLANNPIYHMLIGTDPNQLAIMRNLVGYQFSGNEYVRNILAIGLSPLVSYIAFVFARITKEKKWIILFIVLFLFTSLMKFYDLEKAPILQYWASFLVLSIFFGDRIKTRYFVLFGFVSAAMIVLMYVFIGGSTLERVFSLKGPINRLVLTSAMGLPLHLEIFKYRLPLLLGASLPGIIGRFFGFQTTIRSGRAVMEAVNFQGIQDNVAGVYNGLFLGEAYANFGDLGILAAMIHVPIMFFILHYVFTKLRKTPLTLALYTYLTIAFLFNLHGGYTDFIFNILWLMAILVTLLMYLFAKGLDRSGLIKAKPIPSESNSEQESTAETPEKKSPDLS